MKHYEDLIDRLRKGTGLPVLQALMNEAADAIQSLTAADVRPVVRARWVTRPYMMGQTEYCSCCGENYRRKHNFCPNCGAEMKGEAE